MSQKLLLLPGKHVSPFSDPPPDQELREALGTVTSWIWPRIPLPPSLPTCRQFTGGSNN